MGLGLPPCAPSAAAHMSQLKTRQLQWRLQRGWPQREQHLDGREVPVRAMWMVGPRAPVRLTARRWRPAAHVTLHCTAVLPS